MVAGGTADAAQLGRGSLAGRAQGAVATLEVFLLLRAELTLDAVEVKGLRARHAEEELNAGKISRGSSSRDCRQQPAHAFDRLHTDGLMVVRKAYCV